MRLYTRSYDLTSEENNNETSTQGAKLVVDRRPVETYATREERNEIQENFRIGPVEEMVEKVGGKVLSFLADQGVKTTAKATAAKAAAIIIGGAAAGPVGFIAGIAFSVVDPITPQFTSTLSDRSPLDKQMDSNNGSYHLIDFGFEGQTKESKSPRLGEFSFDREKKVAKEMQRDLHETSHRDFSSGPQRVSEPARDKGPKKEII
jgi:hypothetical protein